MKFLNKQPSKPVVYERRNASLKAHALMAAADAAIQTLKASTLGKAMAAQSEAAAAPAVAKAPGWTRTSIHCRERRSA